MPVIPTAVESSILSEIIVCSTLQIGSKVYNEKTVQATCSSLTFATLRG